MNNNDNISWYFEDNTLFSSLNLRNDGGDHSITDDNVQSNEEDGASSVCDHISCNHSCETSFGQRGQGDQQQKKCDNNCKVAGLRILTIFLLNSYRKSKLALKNANQMIDALKRKNKKMSNHLQLCNRLLKDEQDCNDELNNKVKKSTFNLSKIKDSYEKLKSKVSNLKAEKAILEQKMKTKCEEYDALHAVLSQTKIDLFHCMLDCRNLQIQFCKEQKNAESIKSHNNYLYKEISLMKTEANKAADNYKEVIDIKEQTLVDTKSKILGLKTELDELNDKVSPMERISLNNEEMKLEIQFLRHQVSELKMELDRNTNERECLLCGHLKIYNMVLFKFIHLCCFYLLPSTPPPKPNDQSRLFLSTDTETFV